MPSIIDTIVAHATRTSLLALRTASRAIQLKVDAQLFSHIVLSGTEKCPLLLSPHGRLPSLAPCCTDSDDALANGDHGATTSRHTDATSGFVNNTTTHHHVLAHTQVLTLAAAFSVSSQLAAAFTSLHTVLRVHPSAELGPLTPQVVVDFAPLSPTTALSPHHVHSSPSLMARCICDLECMSAITHHVPASVDTVVTIVTYDPARPPLHGFLQFGKCSPGTRSIIAYLPQSTSSPDLISIASASESPLAEPTTIESSLTDISHLSISPTDRLVPSLTSEAHPRSRAESLSTTTSSVSPTYLSPRHPRSYPGSIRGTTSAWGFTSYTEGQTRSVRRDIYPTLSEEGFTSYILDDQPRSCPGSVRAMTSSGGRTSYFPDTAPLYLGMLAPLVAELALHPTTQHTLVGIEDIPHLALGLRSAVSDEEVREMIVEAVGAESAIYFPPAVAQRGTGMVRFAGWEAVKEALGEVAWRAVMSQVEGSEEAE